MIAFDCLLPLPSASSADRLAVLSRLKNALVGHTARKLTTLRSGGIGSVVNVLQSPDGTTAEESLALCTQAADVLGTISLATVESVSILLAANAHTTLVSSFTRLLDPKLPSSLPLAAQHRLAETLLRAIKSLYIDLGRVMGPRAWGTDLIGASVDVAERKDVRLHWEETVAGKGKGRDVDSMDGVEDGSRNLYDDLRSRAHAAMQEIYAMREVYTDDTTLTTQLRPSAPLTTLLKLLVECSDFTSTAPKTVAYQIPPGSRLRFAALVCSLFAGTVRLPSQRNAVFGGDDGAEVLAALYRLIELGNGKVQEAALHALSALARDYYRLANLINHLSQPDRRPNLNFSDLIQSDQPSLRLAAVTCRTVLHKTLRQVHPALAPSGSAETLVPVLLSLIEKEKTLRGQAAFTFAYLIADNEGLQRVAIMAKVLDILHDVLSEPPTLDQPYETPASIESEARTHEGALLSIACLVAKTETYRHLVLSALILPIIVRSLEHDSAGVRAAACHCLRGLARSVSVLRTSLNETRAAEAIYGLLREDEDVVVQITAAAAVSNLVLEFSPVRQVLIEKGCISRICQLVKSSDPTLRCSALWALKNATYQSSSSFKRSTMQELGWEHLAELVEDGSEEISLNALGILRNVTCTYANDPVTGLLASEMGEGRMLLLLEAALSSKSNDIVLHALYTVVNVCTANETSKLAVASQTGLLRSIVTQLNSPIEDIRSASVWCILNLCYIERDRSQSFRRRPREIVDKLKAIGVDAVLRNMVTTDTSNNVKERVNDALSALS